ncbi:MAG: hypothetical protein B9S34_07065 [Opitutia bacterium Tous-C1TDCM]|nr:MAG: hypothetical protein B9S34_07065 [Opitutae bacterium Tous-C1TDCM]
MARPLASGPPRSDGVQPCPPHALVRGLRQPHAHGLEGNYGAGNAIALAPNPRGKVAGFNPEISNAGLSYIRNKITVRLQYNHRARYLATYNAVDSQLVYRIRRDTLDVKTMDQLTDRLSVYLDVNNVLGEFETGQDRGNRPSQRRVLTPGFFFGVNTRL